MFGVVLGIPEMHCTASQVLILVATVPAQNETNCSIIVDRVPILKLTRKNVCIVTGLDTTTLICDTWKREYSARTRDDNRIMFEEIPCHVCPHGNISTFLRCHDMVNVDLLLQHVLHVLQSHNTSLPTALYYTSSASGLYKYAFVQHRPNYA